MIRCLCLTIAVLASGVATTAAAPSAAITDRLRQTAEPASTCADTVPAATATPTAPELVAGLPAGMRLTPLASGVADRVPSAPARLRLTRLSLPPASGFGTFLAAGPVLFFVESGAVTAFPNGVPLPLATGESFVARPDEFNSLENASDQPASVLRLGLEPADSPDAAIANVIPITPDPAETPSAEPPTSTLLFRAALPVVPTAPVRLFVSCVTWDEPGVGSGGQRHPGPVGLRVERGQLLIDPTVRLVEGGCRLIPANTGYGIGAGDPVPVALLFGAVPEGQSLWNPVDPPPTSPPPISTEVRCSAS